jgi:hypothetical protein
MHSVAVWSTMPKDDAEARFPVSPEILLPGSSKFIKFAGPAAEVLRV